MTLEEQIKEKERRALEEGMLAGLIETCQDLGLSREETMARAAAKREMPEKDIEKYMKKYWK